MSVTTTVSVTISDDIINLAAAVCDISPDVVRKDQRILALLAQAIVDDAHDSNHLNYWDDTGTFAADVDALLTQQS